MHKSLLSKWSWFNDRVKCDIAYWDGLCVFWKEILHHESLNPFWNWLAKHNKWWTPLYRYMLAITTCWWLEWCTVTRGNACNWKFNEKKIRINCKHVLYRFCIMNNLGKGKDIMRERQRSDNAWTICCPVLAVTALDVVINTARWLMTPLYRNLRINYSHKRIIDLWV